MKEEILTDVSLNIDELRMDIDASINSKLDQFKQDSEYPLEQYITGRLAVLEQALDKQISTFMAGFISDTQGLDTRVTTLEIQPSLGLNFDDLLRD